MPACTSFEIQRLEEMLEFEKEAYRAGFQSVCGVDEAGRGPLAGPVVAAACILPKDALFPGLNDSKKLTALARSRLFDALSNHPGVTFGIGIVDHIEIDRINILQATIQAMLSAISKLKISPDCVLVDGMKLPRLNVVQRKIIKGDQLSQSIAAASVLAKVTRDQIMEEFDMKWPEYGFKQHKGYGTEAHRKAIRRYGRSPIHRLSFSLKENTLESNDN